MRNVKVLPVFSLHFLAVKNRTHFRPNVFNYFLHNSVQEILYCFLIPRGFELAKKVHVNQGSVKILRKIFCNIFLWTWRLFFTFLWRRKVGRSEYGFTWWHELRWRQSTTIWCSGISLLSGVKCSQRVKLIITKMQSLVKLKGNKVPVLHVP